MAILDDLIRRLKAAGQFWATDRRYQVHLAACAKAGVQPEKFETFATEVLNGLENNRADTVKDMLRIGPEVYPPYQAPVRYSQYDTPISSEMTFGFSGKKK